MGMNWNWKTASLWHRQLAARVTIAFGPLARAVFFRGLGRRMPNVTYYSEGIMIPDITARKPAARLADSPR